MQISTISDQARGAATLVSAVKGPTLDLLQLCSSSCLQLWAKETPTWVSCPPVPHPFISRSP